MKPKYPYSRVYVEITNICNRACSFCPGTRRAHRRMTVSEFELILAKLEGLTEYIYLHVMGEPLTHPELCELIRIAAAKGFKCSVTTNGTLLSARGDELIASGVYKVNISVHSFENGTNDEYIKYISSVTDFADKASAAGVLSVFRLWNKGYDEGRNINTLDILKDRFSASEWKEGANGYRIRHKMHLEYGDRFEWPDIDAHDYGERVYCHGLGDHFAILADGTVVPCCLDREGVIALGNAYTDDLNEVLASDRAEGIRKGFRNKCAKEELCRKCAYARRFKV